MAGVREAVLDALKRLERGTGQTAHPLKRIVAEVRARTNYSEQTIRTYVVSVMCADAPVHHANATADLRRVDRGLYARNSQSDAHRLGRASLPQPAAINKMTAAQSESPRDAQEAWHWEGRVQAVIVSGLARDGWMIQAVADTASRAAGTDIVAVKGDQRLHVEVKGYPAVVYARGENKGQQKPSHPATQARQWFAGALLKAAVHRADHPHDLVAMGLPRFETYRNLVERISVTLERAGIGVIWVASDGDIDIALRL